MNKISKKYARMQFYLRSSDSSDYLYRLTTEPRNSLYISLSITFIHLDRGYISAFKLLYTTYLLIFFWFQVSLIIIWGVKFVTLASKQNG